MALFEEVSNIREFFNGVAKIIDTKIDVNRRIDAIIDKNNEVISSGCNYCHKKHHVSNKPIPLQKILQEMQANQKNAGNILKKRFYKIMYHFSAILALQITRSQLKNMPNFFINTYYMDCDMMQSLIQDMLAKN
jgi:hypothetical protein